MPGCTRDVLRVHNLPLSPHHACARRPAPSSACAPFQPLHYQPYLQPAHVHKRCVGTPCGFHSWHAACRNCQIASPVGILAPAALPRQASQGPPPARSKSVEVAPCGLVTAPRQPQSRTRSIALVGWDPRSLPLPPPHRHSHSSTQPSTCSHSMRVYLGRFLGDQLRAWPASCPCASLWRAAPSHHPTIPPRYHVPPPLHTFSKRTGVLSRHCAPQTDAPRPRTSSNAARVPAPPAHPLPPPPPFN